MSNNTLIAQWLNRNFSNKDIKRKNILLSDLQTYFVTPDVEQTLTTTSGDTFGPGNKEATSKGLELSDSESSVDKKAKILFESPANAATTMLGLAQSVNKWDPDKTDGDNNLKKYQAFMDFVQDCPFFNFGEVTEDIVHYEEENYKSLIQPLTNIVTQGLEGNPLGVADSIKNLADACTSRVNTTNTHSSMTQNVVNVEKDQNVVRIRLNYTYMTMERTHSSGKGSPSDTFKSTFVVKSRTAIFDSDIWTLEDAKDLAGEQTSSWKLWVKKATTPVTSDATAKSCIPKGSYNEQPETSCV